MSERGNKMLILPCDHYEAEVTITYPTGILREQKAELRDLSDYKRELSLARTFCFVREIEPLLRMGLIKADEAGMLPLYRYCHTLEDGKVNAK
jgi:UDP-3-O-[3-hydroxymyristoyl] N-acetylglucosamine deacetylase/3-hydroxyacyl-[acyl-carrier-protein] dehydratase